MYMIHVVFSKLLIIQSCYIDCMPFSVAVGDRVVGRVVGRAAVEDDQEGGRHRGREDLEAQDVVVAALLKQIDLTLVI